jgi:hypothetical protein
MGDPGGVETPGEPGLQRDIAGDGQGGRQIELLKDKPDLLTAALGATCVVQGRDDVTVQDDPAGVRRIQQSRSGAAACFCPSRTRP